MAPMESHVMEAPAVFQRIETQLEGDVPLHLLPGVGTSESDVVIRAPQQASTVRCDSCKSRFVAGGPTAYASDEPLCDVCVFEHDAQLAMVLAAVSVLRAFGSGEPTEADAQAALDLLGFARLYETFADRYGPRREPQHQPDRAG